VALLAAHAGVLAGQPEGQFVVIKAGAVAVHTVVAWHAPLPEVGRVLSHKARVDARVASGAHRIVSMS